MRAARFDSRICLKQNRFYGHRRGDSDPQAAGHGGKPRSSAAYARGQYPGPAQGAFLRHLPRSAFGLSHRTQSGARPRAVSAGSDLGADINYGHLARAFVYLLSFSMPSRASRRLALENTLEASLPLMPLIRPSKPERRNLAACSITPIARAIRISPYRQKSPNTTIAISMSRPGNPFDNAKDESFIEDAQDREIQAGPSLTSAMHGRRIKAS